MLGLLEMLVLVILDKQVLEILDRQEGQEQALPAAAGEVVVQDLLGPRHLLEEGLMAVPEILVLLEEETH
jgi:hypothetical protein